MAKENVRQHFIPQCYLRNFSVNEKFVVVYSKTNEKKGYPQSIAKTAYENYFYSIPGKYLQQRFPAAIDENFVEKEILAKNIEALYSKLLNKIIQAGKEVIKSGESVSVFDNGERNLFAALIAIQYLRMPSIREKYWGVQKKVQNERNDLMSKLKKAELNVDCSEILALEREDDYAPVLHSEIFLDENLIAEIQNQIVKKKWQYKLSETDAIFTSDNPILLKPHIPDQLPYYEGFGMRGVEIIFPISKNIILTIWDEEIVSGQMARSNEFILLTDAELRKYNCYQYICANDEVYSSKNNFEIIRILKSANGNENKEMYKKRTTIKVNGK